MSEVLEQCGFVSHEEAIQIANRMTNSIFRRANGTRDGVAYARVSIPADPLRDDDIRLTAYIKQQQQAESVIAAAMNLVHFDRTETDGQVLIRTAWADLHNAIDALRRVREGQP